MIDYKQQKRKIITNSQHAFFGSSRFTYPARNSTFLSIIGESFPKDIHCIFLLGSGPIEPFEVAAMPPYLQSTIIAIDNDHNVNNSIRKGIKDGYIRPSALVEVCSAKGRENPYLIDNKLIHQQIDKVKNIGCQVSLNEDIDNDHIIKFGESRFKIKPIKQDLRYEYISKIKEADIIFEGFMIINWVKEAESAKRIRKFLGHLFANMRKDAWFATATSITHYKADFQGSEPYMRQIVNSGRLPAAGALGKWTINEDKKVTSQFAAVYRSKQASFTITSKLGDMLENGVINALRRLDIKNYFQKELNLFDLMEKIEEENIIAFTETGNKQYKTTFCDWNQISGKINNNNNSSRFEIDNYP